MARPSAAHFSAPCSGEWPGDHQRPHAHRGWVGKYRRRDHRYLWEQRYLSRRQHGHRTKVTKVGAGKLTIAGSQTYETLVTEAGRTDLASAVGTGAATFSPIPRQTSARRSASRTSSSVPAPPWPSAARHSGARLCGIRQSSRSRQCAAERAGAGQHSFCSSAAARFCSDFGVGRDFFRPNRDQRQHAPRQRSLFLRVLIVGTAAYSRWGGDVAVLGQTDAFQVQCLLRHRPGHRVGSDACHGPADQGRRTRRGAPCIHPADQRAVGRGVAFHPLAALVRPGKKRAAPARLPRPVLDAAMRAERITANEVRSAIRSAGTASLADVEAVVLETDGSVSVVTKSSGRARDALEDVCGLNAES